MGILDRLNVQVLGTPIHTLEVSEDRDLFVKALNGALSGSYSPEDCYDPIANVPHLLAVTRS